MATHIQHILSDGNPDFQTLQNLKNKVRHNKKLRLHMSAQEDTADNAGDDLAETWYKKMIKIMGQIDDHVKYVVPFPKEGRTFCFLDLGCCPGGFSTYILKKNKTCTGVGVSLPPESSKHDYLIPSPYNERHTVIFHDLTLFQLGLQPLFFTHPYTSCDWLPQALCTRQYDLIILDGHQLRNQVDSGSILAISQIIIALLSTKLEGSTIVMKLSNPESNFTARMLFMLDMLSSSLIAYKPYLMHRTKASFYAIARGVGGGQRHQYLNVLLPQFRRLWMELWYRTNRYVNSTDLDFIASSEELTAYARSGRLEQLCSSVWEVQKNALAKLSEDLGA